jgi:hypothetical protein
MSSIRTNIRTGGGLRNHDEDVSRQTHRAGSPRNNAGHSGRDHQDAKHQAGYETDEDDAY